MPDQFEVIHVVAGILRDARGRVLLAQRPAGKHLAGLWEFPGGKCEPGETPVHALRRELHEEIGVDAAGASQRLIAVPWRYPQKSVLLDVYEVRDYRGEPHGREGQALRWAGIDELKTIEMPPADRPVVAALRLPTRYVITTEPNTDRRAFLQTLERVLAHGERLVQLRSKLLDQAHLRPLAHAARDLVAAAGGTLLLNGHIELARQLGIGVHLPSSELLQLRERPLDSGQWLAASCHDERELAHAAAIGVDFAVLGPVQRTLSHPRQAPLGWARFSELRSPAPFPVFALGGLTVADMGAARSAGAHGIAGISAFWPVGAPS